MTDITCADPLLTVQANVDYQVHCTLKTGKEVRGRLLACDRHMNLLIGDATIIDRAAKTETSVRQITVRGTSVGAVHLGNDALVYPEPEDTEGNPEKLQRVA